MKHLSIIAMTLPRKIGSNVVFAEVLSKGLLKSLKEYMHKQDSSF